MDQLFSVHCSGKRVLGLRPALRGGVRIADDADLCPTLLGPLQRRRRVKTVGRQDENLSPQLVRRTAQALQSPAPAPVRIVDDAQVGRSHPGPGPTADDDDVLDLAASQGVDLPVEQRASPGVHEAGWTIVGQRTQAASAAGAEQDGAHGSSSGWFDPQDWISAMPGPCQALHVLEERALGP